MIINIRFIAMFVAQTAGAVVRGQRVQGLGIRGQGLGFVAAVDLENPQM